MAQRCDVCNQQFETKKGLRIHETKVDHEPYHKEPVLRREYLEKGRTIQSIANQYSLDESYVSELLERHEIEKRSLSEAQRKGHLRRAVPRYIDGRGYAFWQDRTDRDADKVYCHRLLAVAKYGIDSVTDKDVHHKNGVPWDNRPENLEVLTKAKHGRTHGEQ